MIEVIRTMAALDIHHQMDRLAAEVARRDGAELRLRIGLCGPLNSFRSTGTTTARRHRVPVITAVIVAFFATAS